MWLIVVVHDKVFIQWVLYSMDAVYPQFTINRWTRVPAAARRGAADGVHPGVARGLTFSVDLRQDRAPSHADTAELRPCHPNPATTTALNERRSCGQERCLKLLAVKHEVVRRLELLRRRWR